MTNILDRLKKSKIVLKVNNNIGYILKKKERERAALGAYTQGITACRNQQLLSLSGHFKQVSQNDDITRILRCGVK